MNCQGCEVERWGSAARLRTVSTQHYLWPMILIIHLRVVMWGKYLGNKAVTGQPQIHDQNPSRGLLHFACLDHYE